MAFQAAALSCSRRPNVRSTLRNLRQVSRQSRLCLEYVHQNQATPATLASSSTPATICKTIRSPVQFSGTTLNYSSEAPVHDHYKDLIMPSGTCEDTESENRIAERQGKAPHIPVMLEEVLETLEPANGQTVIDMTFGGGGHTRAVLSAAPTARLFVLDRDPIAYGLAQELASEHSNVVPLLGRFSEVHQLLSPYGIKDNSVDSILFDVGASSMQFDQAGRGFSLSQNGPLDMRMDGSRDPGQPTASDLVNHLDEDGLYKIIKYYGEEKMARLIARAIVDTRHTFGSITNTQQLAKVVASVFEGSHRRDKLMRHSHVATKTFQALRIFVNNELNELHNGLLISQRLLKPGGICVAVTFHSLEDRIVKRHFHSIDMDAKHNMSVTDHHRNSAKTHSKQELLRLMEKQWKPISKRVLVSSHDDVMSNPRARSAKLRAAVKL